jgi:hypothetical protein
VAQEPAAPTSTMPAQRLAGEDFAAAVKDALRGLGRGEVLRESPLLGTAMVAQRQPASGVDPTDALRTLLREAVSQLERSPRDRRAFRALHHTYVQPAPTQAAAAELLDLPMTTYRRHLASGIARVTELLQQAERDAR